MQTIAYFLSYPFTYALLGGVLVWAIFFSHNKIFNFSLFFLSILSSWITAGIMKIIFQISRPEAAIESTYSFPSQHSAIFAALAAVMFLLDVRAGYIFSIIALLVAASRVIVGSHYIVDVIAGLIIGAGIGIMCFFLFKKLL